MPLSQDPAKRANSLANLKQNRTPQTEPAAVKEAPDYQVLDYTQPKREAKTSSRAAARGRAPATGKPPAAAPPTELAPPPAIGGESVGVPWLVLGGAVALLVLVFVLNQTGRTTE